MTSDLKTLYRELGYTGPLPEPERRTRGTDVSRPQAQVRQDLPPLDEESIRVIEDLLDKQPQKTIDEIRRLRHYDWSDDTIKDVLGQARRALNEPDKMIEEIRARKPKPAGTRRTRGVLDRPPIKVPSELILYPEITIEPDEYKFEPMADALGWIFNSIYYMVRDRVDPDHVRAEFRLHDKYPSNFVYELKNKQGQLAAPDETLTVALFADFGTGLYHSQYIARNIAGLKPDYAIHLGDVYYAGRDKEFEKNFKEPLEPVLKTSRLFSMNANHEMFSGGFPYFGYISHKKTRQAGWLEQDQEGSYFCLRNAKYQIIGIDTAYHQDGRHPIPHLNGWLGERLREGKSASPKLTNILLSPNEPYTLGDNELTGLYLDLREFIDAKLIDFWFWGNTHYCTLFDKSEKTPFIGGCIGHGGHPIYKNDVEKMQLDHQKLKEMPEALWVDTSPRFPSETGLRPDLANNGFCLMTLSANSVKLSYIDWLNKEQYAIDFPV